MYLLEQVWKKKTGNWSGKCRQKSFISWVHLASDDSMVVSGSRKRWDRWHTIPQLAVYTTYMLPSGGLYATYHLLREPETTIE